MFCISGEYLLANCFAVHTYGATCVQEAAARPRHAGGNKSQVLAQLNDITWHHRGIGRAPRGAPQGNRQGNIVAV